MTKLMAVISPAKLIDEQSHYPGITCTQPEMLEEAEYLVSKLRKLSGSKLSELMDLSKDLGDLNKKRYMNWHLPFDHGNAHPAILMFKGEVYRGLKAEEFSGEEFGHAQKHLRILSGLYGILKPLDLVQPYRLMMGTPFSPEPKTKNLYTFWGDKISHALDKEMDKKGVLINLASSEYFKAINPKTFSRRIITCDFKEKKADKYVIVMTYAKQARGQMARFMVTQKTTKAEDLKSFDSNGYIYQPKLSTEDHWIFTRG
jgi:uncharacterized protein